MQPDSNFNVQGFISDAQNAGYGEGDITPILAKHGYNPDGSPMNQQNPQQSSGGGFNFSDLLPVIGGVGGEFVGGPIGAGIGSALGQAGEDLVTGKPIGGDVVTQGLLGAGTAGLGGVVGKGVGKAAELEGEKLAMGGLGLGAKDATKFAQTNAGKKLTSVLGNNSLTGTDLGGLEAKLAAENHTYGQIANSPELTITPGDLEAQFKTVTSKLAGTKDDQALTDKMRSELDNFYQQQGINRLPDGSFVQGGQILGSDALPFKHSFDAATTNKQFLADPAGYDFNRNMGTIFRGAINNAADKAGLSTDGGAPLSTVGNNISDLYDIHKLAANKTPGGVKNILHYGLGAAAGTILGGNPILGAGVQMAGEKIASNPKVAGAAAKGLFNLSDKLPMIGGLAGAAVPGALNSLSQVQQVGENHTNNTGDNGSYNPHSLMPPVPGSNGTNSNTIGSESQDLAPLTSGGSAVQTNYPLKNYLADMARAGGNPIAQEQYTRAYQAAQEGAQSQVNAYALPEGEKDFMLRANNTNTMMNQLRTLIQQKGTGPLNDVPAVQYIKAQTDPQYALMLTLMTQLRGASVKAIEGKAPSNFDLKALNAMPSPGDSSATALTKLAQAQKLLKDQYNINLPYYGLNVANQTPSTQ